MYIGCVNMWFRWELALATILCCCHVGHSVRVRDRWLVDNAGRVRLYHGFNSVEKQFPWYPNGRGSQLDLSNTTVLVLLQEWGFNVARVGTMWAGVEPAQGHFNETYLAITGDILRQLEKRGIVAILDAHQDVISSAFGSYDGVPRWLIDQLPPSTHPYPWPVKQIKFWAEGYITQAVGNAFQSIYDNKANAHDAFALFWKKVVQTFNTTAYPNVLGYELINEPWAGNIYTDPDLLLPGVAGKKNLLPLYDVIVDSIRSVEREALVFYEPVTWSVMASGKFLGTGFERVPGREALREHSVLSWHYYCWFITASMGSQNDTYLLKKECDDMLGPRVFDAIDKDIVRTGGSSFLTEFGMCMPDGNPDSINTIECNAVLDLADKHLQSWTYWDAAFFDSRGNPRWSVVKAFSRPYARAIAGIPVYMDFNKSNMTFEFQYMFWSNITAPTEIFVPPLHYGDRFTATVSPGFSWTYNTASHILNVSPSPSLLNVITEADNLVHVRIVSQNIIE